MNRVKNKFVIIADLLVDFFEGHFFRIHRSYRAVRHFFVKMFSYAKYLIKNGGDHDWDFAYLENLMQWKMSNMADCIEANGFIYSDKRVAKQLRYAVKLIELIKTDHYENIWRDELESKWGKTEINFGEADERGFVSAYFSNSKVTTEEEREQCDKDFADLCDRSDKKRKELYNRLFRHMERYIQNWWD